MRTAADVMTKHVVDIDANATVAQAVEKMKQWNVSSLLVARKDATDTWGFMSQTDIVEKVVAQGINPETVHVYEIMTKPVITVPPNCSLQDCAALMARADIRRVLVFDGQDIVGIVSSTDIFNAT
ncbi:MAG: CBS domain-containing protein [Planctomycetaceae bacterium]|nr:MAG: CBS domain-containing protein [Planctomycetaceae bacterium]